MGNYPQVVHILDAFGRQFPVMSELLYLWYRCFEVLKEREVQRSAFAVIWVIFVFLVPRDPILANEGPLDQCIG